MWPDGTAFRYTGSTGRDGKTRPGAEQLLKELSQRHGWQGIKSPEGKLIGLHPTEGGITLEPGSQVEYSTPPVANVSAVAKVAGRFESTIDEITRQWGLRWIALGLNPRHSVDDIDVIPSPRYGIMTRYLGKSGSLGTTMMRLTSSVQINLDYASEAEAVQMLRVALAAAPLSHALFGNSPLRHGKETGFLSFRAKVWEDTDPDRTGLLPFVFDKSFAFEKYAEHAVKNPLMFAIADKGGYLETNGLSLDDIEKGKLPGATATEDNRMTALRQLFPEARLKPGYVEVRSVDGQTPANRYAAAAFWTGLLYHEPARELALKLLSPIGHEGRLALYDAASRNGLRGSAMGISLRNLAETLVEAAREGLLKRQLGEERWLAPAERAAGTGLNPADHILQAFRQDGLERVEAVAAGEEEPSSSSADCCCAN